MSKRAELLRAVAGAASFQAKAAAVAALSAYDRRQADAVAQDRELDLRAHFAVAAMIPVPLFEHHTGATDWVADMGVPEQDYRTAMIAEASAWMSTVPREVLADQAEFGEQAAGRARTAASAYGDQMVSAQREFLSCVAYLAQREGASGLPQIDQLIDGNNQPAATPYPTQVFDNFAPPQNDYNGGIEDENHGSQATSERAPMIQQLVQQDSSGSGFGSGPEKPNEHDTSFDTSNSYAEVPLGPPGQIPTTPASTSQAGSAPTPVTGPGAQPLNSDGRPPLAGRQSARIPGYSRPDAQGFQWKAAYSAEGDPEDTDTFASPYHGKCGSYHYPEQRCGSAGAHTASVAIGYQTDAGRFQQLHYFEQQGAAEAGSVLSQAGGDLRRVAAHHNRLMQAFAATSRQEEEIAWLHGYLATVRPVLAEGAFPQPAPGQPGRVVPDFLQAAEAAFAKGAPFAGYKDFGDCVSKNSGKGDPSAYCGYIKHRVEDGKKESAAIYHRMAALRPPWFGTAEQEITAFLRRQAASQLPQVQQVTDPNNVPTPEADQLPPAVMFPVNEAFQQQWVTGPEGAQPRSTERQASRMRGLPSGTAALFGHMDALEGRPAQHKDNFAFSTKAHGQYLRAWNRNRGALDALTGKDYLEKTAYGDMTGRPDLHQHYLDAYEQAQTLRPNERIGSRKQADAWSRPLQTTDNDNPPFNSAQTTPQPGTSPDAAAGARDGAEDARSGQRPTFADVSSRVSPYVSAYSQAYAQARAQLAGQQDVPGSLGGDSGQAQNSQLAQQQFQTAQASKKGFRVSAAFVTPEVMDDPSFLKGYKFARSWQPGDRLVSRGTPAFEAGLYAGITDSPQRQAHWAARHAAGSHPDLAARLQAHQSFTRAWASEHPDTWVRGLYMQAGTSVDLITDGPGTSPDPLGSTPLNGPGTAPPSGGRGDPARSGGPPPYQGAQPLGAGPVVRDDVAGRPQEPEQPDGPLAQGFSGPGAGYGNQNLAPRAPNQAAQPGYSNPSADEGNPDHDGNPRAAAFRATIQANLRRERQPA